MIDKHILKIGFKCLCPKCEDAHIFKSKYALDLHEKCPKCDLDLAQNDSADGPAVIMTFILGFSIVPLALVLDVMFTIPIWVHLIIWTALSLVMIIGMLKPLKAYIIGLQYKHRPNDWNE